MLKVTGLNTVTGLVIKLPFPGTANSNVSLDTLKTNLLTASQVIFYIIAAFILGTGLLAVTTRKIFRSAIWLLFSLIGIAALFFWMQLQFIAAVQIVVYVGGIVVLIIFSIFLTQQAGNEMAKPVRNRALFAAITVLAGFIFSYRLIFQ